MSSLKLLSLSALVFWLSVAVFGQRLNTPPEVPTGKLEISVIKGYNGKPVKNASVILHAVTDKGEQEKGGYQVKTTEDGVARIDEVPYGKIRLQVIVPGFQTYGEDFTLAEPAKSISVKLEEPKGQFSIYK